ncbi:Alpha/Beta hydrolase protein [Phaeosphaeriaceae sp. PMI808]|nr:Alpha/Beta hydrolase protein [Phaeosphaeriaceae sp. PMI808]
MTDPLESSQRTQSIFNNPAPPESEDCLYLNIYAPSNTAGGAGRAVLFWIFGGSLQFGSAAVGQQSYDGTAFASYEDIIVVTTNYRTNVFGFPGSTELPLTERNLGFLDQRFAMNWVQRNIHAFGGDPTRVTIFGESAGGYSIDAHLTSYPRESSPPFRAAILQSGQYTYRSTPDVVSSVAWNQISAQLGCPGPYASKLACVRAANSSLIQNIINVNTLISAPVYDNVTFVSDPASRRLSGDIAHIPVLGGTNSQEGRVFTINQNNLTLFLETTFGTRAPYLIPESELHIHSITAPASQMTTITNFSVPQALWANATASIGIPTWRYYFNASFQNTQYYPELGAFHASEVALVFRTYVPVNTTTQQHALAQYLQSTWARFAKNPYAGPGWNMVGTGAERNVLVGAYDEIKGGLLLDTNATVVAQDWSLGVLGDVGSVRGSGVTVLPQRELDGRCELYRPLFEAIVGKGGMPPV